MTGSLDEIKTHWVARYGRNRTGYPELLGMDPFESWERNAMPESSVSGELINGLRVAYALGLENEQAVAFFRRACQVAQRAIDEGKLTSPLSASSFPLNRGALCRDYSYARALLAEPIDVRALQQSSRDFEEWCKGYEKGGWDSQAQANYLSAVRLALIRGDVDRAAELLKRKKSFKWHSVEHTLWKRLVEKRGRVREDEQFKGEFAEYFDKVRDPRFVPDVYIETDVVRLELGAMHEKYLASGSGTIDWKRVIDAVSGENVPVSR